jgi:hypothetical protein
MRNNAQHEGSKEVAKAITDEWLPEDFVCSIVLLKAEEVAATMLKPYSTASSFFIQPYSTMLGATCTTGQFLRDETQTMGVYFVFTDLSIRIAGVYSFQASVVHIPTYA